LIVDEGLGRFARFFLNAKVAKGTNTFRFFSRRDAKTQRSFVKSNEGTSRFFFNGTRIERIERVCTDFDSFAITDGDGFVWRTFSLKAHLNLKLET
jgi:hypothetical protein